MTTQHGPRPRTGGAPAVRVALALLVPAVLLGLLGMHALASHAGTSDMPGMPGMSGMSHEAAPVSSPAADGAVAQMVRAAPDDGGGHSGGHDAMMLCALMLATAAVALLARAVCRRATRAALSLPRSRAPGPQAGAAGPGRPVPTGPPDVWAWSVLRC